MENRITVRQIDPRTYEVAVQAATPTRHIVRLPREYYLQLTAGQVSEPGLIEESFRFLLEREPNTSILARFDLAVIGDYFGEYELEIAQRLGLTNIAEGDPT
jgi:hypothetical protein